MLRSFLNNKSIIFATIFSLSLLCGGHIVSENAKALRVEIDQYIKENDKLKKRCAELQDKITALRIEKNRIRNDLRTGIHVPHLRRIVRSTINYLNLKNVDDWERLVLLTIAAESDCGHLLKQVRGPARGIAQLEQPTEVDVLAFYKHKMPDTYKKIQNLRISAKLSVHEAEVNNAYAIAMCVGEYLRRGYRPYNESMENLAKAWKKHYNTYLGKGTVKGAIAKTKKFIGDI